MRLSRYQRLVLQNMQELQGREPSYRRALRSLVPAWILFLAAALRNFIQGWALSAATGRALVGLQEVLPPCRGRKGHGGLVIVFFLAMSSCCGPGRLAKRNAMAARPRRSCDMAG